METADFGWALRMLKERKKVARKGWNGKGMWLGLHSIKGSFYREEQPDVELSYSDYIFMKTVDNKIVPWLASQTDMLAEDWEVK